MQRVLFSHLDDGEFKGHLGKAEELLGKKTKQVALLKEILKYNRELHAKEIEAAKAQVSATEVKATPQTKDKTPAPAQEQQASDKTPAAKPLLKKATLVYPLVLDGSLSYQMEDPNSALRQMMEAETLLGRTLSQYQEFDTDRYTAFLGRVENEIGNREKEIALLKDVIDGYKAPVPQDAKEPDLSAPKTKSLVVHLDLDGALNHEIENPESRLFQLIEARRLLRLPANPTPEEEEAYDFFHKLLDEAVAKQIVDDNQELWDNLAKEAKEGGFSDVVTTIGTNRQDKTWDDFNSTHGRGSFAPVFKYIPTAGIRAALHKIGAGAIRVTEDSDILANVYANQGSSEGAERILDDQQFKTKATVVKNPRQYTHKDHGHYICDGIKVVMEYKDLHRGDKKPSNTEDQKSYDRHIFIDDKRSLLTADIEIWEAATDLMPKKEFAIRSWPNVDGSKFWPVIDKTIVGTGVTDPNYKQNTILLTAILLGVFDEAEFQKASFNVGIEQLRKQLEGYTQAEIGKYHYTPENMALFRKYRKLDAPTFVLTAEIKQEPAVQQQPKAAAGNGDPVLQHEGPSSAPKANHTVVTAEEAKKLVVTTGVSDPGLAVGVSDPGITVETGSAQGKPAVQRLFTPKAANPSDPVKQDPANQSANQVTYSGTA